MIIYHMSNRKYPPHLFKRDQRRNVTCDIITFIDGGNVFCASDTLLVLHFSYILETFLSKNSIKCTHFVLTLFHLSLLHIILLEMYGWMVSIRENYCYKPWLLDFTLDALAEMDPYIYIYIHTHIYVYFNWFIRLWQLKLVLSSLYWLLSSP